MTNKKYDTLVLLGRFQPVHSAHLEIMQQACFLARELIIIVGSANQPRTYKNPFTSKERELMLNNALDTIDTANCRVHIVHNPDTIYDDQAWATRVQKLVNDNKLTSGSVSLIGHYKPGNEYLTLGMFPQWEFIEIGNLKTSLNATDIRALYFRKNSNLDYLRNVVPDCTLRWLEGWQDTPEFNQVVAEREFAESYRKQWSGTPYPVNFVCVDACVIKSGHVLMIHRKSNPGKGLWAMPGGYVNTDERLEDAMIRELREETKLKVPAAVLKGSIKRRELLDHPDRSSRGRVMSVVYLIDLGMGPLDKVKGSSDAVTADWIEFSKLETDRCFEDHREAIQMLTGI